MGYDNYGWKQSLELLRTRNDFVKEVLEFVVFGKYEFGHMFDKTRLKRIHASSLEELELKLVVMGF